MSFRKSLGWQLLRSAEAIDNPALAATTFDSKPAFAQSIVAQDIKGLELMCTGQGDENGIVGVRLWGGRNDERGPAQLIADITFTLGTMVCQNHPQTGASYASVDENGDPVASPVKFADSAAITSRWPVDIKAVNSGNNLLCGVSFDALDLAWLAVEVITLTNVTTAEIFVGYFS